jgi:hypothetical protein
MIYREFAIGNMQGTKSEEFNTGTKGVPKAVYVINKARSNPKNMQCRLVSRDCFRSYNDMLKMGVMLSNVIKLRNFLPHPALSKGEGF